MAKKIDFNLCFLLMYYMISVKPYKSLPYAMLLTVLFKYLGVGLEDEFSTSVNKKKRIDEVVVGKTKVFREAKKKGGKRKNVVKDIPIC